MSRHHEANVARHGGISIWRPGMRCVCIGAFVRHVEGDEALPVKGEFYTVREVDTSTETLCLRLIEIVNRPRDYGDGHGTIEASFQASMFRPLKDTRLDQFRAHLAPNPRERVPA